MISRDSPLNFCGANLGFLRPMRSLFLTNVAALDGQIRVRFTAWWKSVWKPFPPLPLGENWKPRPFSPLGGNHANVHLVHPEKDVLCAWKLGKCISVCFFDMDTGSVTVLHAWITHLQTLCSHSCTGARATKDQWRKRECMKKDYKVSCVLPCHSSFLCCCIMAAR